MWCESETRNKFLLLFFPCLHPYLSFQNEWMVRGEKWGKLILFSYFSIPFYLNKNCHCDFFLVWWLDWLSSPIKSSQEATYNIDIFTINLLLTFSIHFNLKKRIRPVELIIRQFFSSSSRKGMSEYLHNNAYNLNCYLYDFPFIFQKTSKFL